MTATFSRFRVRVALPILAIGVAVVGFTGFRLASAQAPYTVEDGDSLYGIAINSGVPDDDLSVWISQVVTLNSLSSQDALTVGQKLTLPSISSGSSGSAGGGVNTRPTSSSTYTVKSGDTLYGIGADSGVADLGSWVEAVLSLNNLSSANTIAVGDVLRLPVTQVAASASSGSSSGSGVNTNTTTEYTVQAGDTLYDIAIKNNVPEKDLTAWLNAVLSLNGLDSADMIGLGKALKVPGIRRAPGASSSSATINTTQTVSYTVKSGDTLYDIGMKNGAKDATFSSWVDAVLSLNSLSSPDVLREGDSLKLPAIAGATGSTGSGSGSTSSSATASGGGFRFSGDSVTYTVKSGETWTSIARSLQAPEAQVPFWISEAQKLSKVSADEKLVAGVVLLVPAQGSITGSAPASTGGSSSASSSGSSSSTNKPTTTYTVVSGDTLSDIAEKQKIGPGQFSTWMKDVLSLNKMDSADVLVVGQKLTVPGAAATTPSSSSSSTASANRTPSPNASATPPSFTAPAAASTLVRGNNGTCYYTILSGDSWDSIASKLGVSNDKKADWIDGISALNGISGAALPVGDQIRLLC